MCFCTSEAALSRNSSSTWRQWRVGAMERTARMRLLSSVLVCFQLPSTAQQREILGSGVPSPAVVSVAGSSGAESLATGCPGYCNGARRKG